MSSPRWCLSVTVPSLAGLCWLWMGMPRAGQRSVSGVHQCHQSHIQSRQCEVRDQHFTLYASLSSSCRRGGHLLDDCSNMEEVVEGSNVYLHHGYITEKLLHFEPGDVLGMLLRLNRSSDFSPLLVRTNNTTGFYNARSGLYTNKTTLSSGPLTVNSPLLSLDLCELFHTNCLYH